jgi:glycine/D-amino acid oxidase-like deaminating enzyme
LQGEHRDLRTGRTVWEAVRLPLLPRSDLRRTIETDILIVGAGITGAIVADVLTQAGFTVAIAERRAPLRGSTVASTALLLGEIDTPLTIMADRIGRRDAARAWLRSRRAVPDLARRADGIACDWAQRDALYLAGDVLDAQALKKEAEARQGIGWPCEYLGKKELQRAYGIARDGAIRSSDNAEVDPVRLAAGFLRRALARGARIFAPAEITEVMPSPRQVTARARNGFAFKASALIYASGYELPRLVPRAGHRVVSTWAMATTPQPDRLWGSRCLIWEASDPYLYMRSTRDGRVVIGGEDEDFSNEAARDALTGRKIAALGRKLQALFPALDARAEFAWAGSFGDSRTGLPAIGRLRGKPSCFAVLGFGGNGITFAMIAAQLLRGYLRGPRDPDSDLFAFK